MSNRLTRLFSRTPGQRRGRLAVFIAGALLVPLAVAGFVSGGLASADQRLDDIPALIVNNDEMVTQTTPDGASQPVLAGRLLVTELTKKSAAGFDWQLSSTAEAEKALSDGSAYAVLSIPKDFSSSIVSISGSDPRQADLSIRTDDAHAYLAGSVAQSVGDAMSGAFGREITKQYLSGFYANLAGMGGSLSSAADGATQVSSGVASLATGLDQLAAGAASAASGAADAASGADSFANGVDGYTAGVDGIAGGLQQLADKTAGLGALGDGITAYTSGISTQAAALQQLTADVMADPANPPADLASRLATISGTLAAYDANSGRLAAGAAGLGDLSSGIGQTAAGAAQLSGGSASLRDGAGSLASGIDGLAAGVSSLSDGAAASATGAHTLAGGASSLATGLSDGAKQASSLSDMDAEATASVVSDPVAVSAERNNPIAGIGEVIGMVFVPIGLWIGALVIFLLMRPLSALALASTASTPQLVVRALGRAAGIAVGQAVLVVALLHTALGVSWASLPATLSFAVLTALAFAAVHHFLTVAFGRMGLVVSLLLVTVQLLASGALYPVQVLSGPFQAISPFLPLTWAVHGMQLIVSGAGGAAVAGAAVILALFGALSFVGSLFVVSRRRGARSWGFALARG